MTAGIKFHRVSSMFEGSSHHKLPSVNSAKTRAMLRAIGFSVPYKPTLKWNFDYDIPYLLGYDTKSNIIYSDKDYDPKSYPEGDASDANATHEEIEKLLERFDLNYQQRHHIATHVENLMADYLDFDWNSYQRFMTHAWHQSYSKWKGQKARLKVPPTLDMSPYMDEDDKLISAMRKAGAKDPGEE